MTRITKDTTIGEAIQYDAGIVSILMGAGMHCVGCPSSAGETLEEAAMVHGLYFMNDIIFHWICGEYKILGLE